MVSFEESNLAVGNGTRWELEQYDVIFCRNVIIYFDRPTQERLFHKFSRQLVEGGYMFVGHSESLHHMDVPLVPVAPALYRKADGRNRN